MDSIVNRLSKLGFAEFASEWMLEAIALTISFNGSVLRRTMEAKWSRPCLSFGTSSPVQ